MSNGRVFNEARIMADAAAGVSIGSTAFTWIHQANDVFQLIATLIAIASGIYALKFHMNRGKDDEDN